MLTALSVTTAAHCWRHSVPAQLMCHSKCGIWVRLFAVQCSGMIEHVHSKRQMSWTDVIDRHRSCNNQCSQRACNKKHLLSPLSPYNNKHKMHVAKSSVPMYIWTRLLDQRGGNTYIYHIYHTLFSHMKCVCYYWALTYSAIYRMCCNFIGSSNVEVV